MDFFRIVRGDDVVSEREGLDAFHLLAPVLDAAPDHEDAQDAASRTIARMPRDSLGAALLDWWYFTTTGASPPLGLAFNLPDTVPVGLRAAMESVAALTHAGLTVPPRRWVRSARELDRLLPELETALQLDSYGKSKLPAEREVWSWLQDELAATAGALRDGRPASEYELDLRSYEREMKTAGIEENSRRWREMVKRAQTCVERVNHIVGVQRLVEPWTPREQPTTVDELPREVTGLGPITAFLLTPITSSPELDPSVTESERVADLIERTCTDRSPAELSWLAAVCAGWMGATGHVVAGLEDVHTRRTAIEERLRALRSDGVDADEIEVHLLDHELDEAERLLEQTEAERRDARRTHTIRTSLERLRANAVDGPRPEGWDDQLERAERAVAAGDLDEAERLRQELERALRLSRRSEAIGELEDVRAELERLEAPSSLLAEIAEELATLTEHSDRVPDPTVLQRNRERLESIRQQRRDDAERRLYIVRDLLHDERELITAEALTRFELDLDEAESHLTVGEVMAALDVLDQLIGNINAQRVHRWTASEGEATLVDHIVEYCTQQVHFDPDDVRRLYVAAKTKPFVILAGLTGSGKSTIARLFAAALGADSHNGRFRRIAVRPDWIDQSEVLGVVNPLNNRFEPGWLASVARQCEQNPDQLHVVLLDEMNLAPVEQYLAEYLSALEEARSGSERTMLPLYPPGMAPENRPEWPPALAFPRNLLVIGTVNVDETTRPLSERVLDRANVLQLSVTVSDAHHQQQTRSVQPWHVPFAEWELLCRTNPDDAHHEFLVEVADLLQRVGIGVGQRAHIELERFISNAEGVLTPERSLDLGVLQRILPKVRGFKRDLVDGFHELHELLLSAGCERSAAVVRSWLDEQVSDDEFLDGTDARVGLVR